MYGSENQTPTWKIILMVLLAIFSIARILHKCSAMKQRNNFSGYENESNQVMPPYQQTYPVQQKQYKIEFPFYHVFESATKEELSAQNWVKVYQDSLIRFDLSGKLKIPANWYFQKPVDEKVRYVLLTPEDIQVTVYQFPTKKTLLSNMYYLRLQDFKIHGKGSYYQESNEASYSFSYRDIPYKGVCIGLKENETMVIFAFESRDHSFKKLDKFAGRFLVNHLVID